MLLKRLLPLFSFFMLVGCSQLGAPGTTPLEYQPPAYEQWKMPNGVTVLYMQDKELPLVNATLYLNGGTLWAEGTEKLAAQAMGGQMRVGGTKKLSPAQLDYQLEKLSASIGSTLSGEYGQVSFQCLDSDLSKVFPLFADVILEPRFDEARLDLWRAGRLDGIKRRKDDSSTIASLALTDLLLSKTRYGYISTSADVKKIRRVDLLRAHRRFVRPNGAYLVVSGSVSKEEIEKLTKKYLSRWQKRVEELPPLPPITVKPKPRFVFIEMPVAQQSSVYLGQLGVKRHSPDRYAISTFNELFGSGGFDSRLMRRVRTELGLAYSVYGGINPGRIAGRNTIAMQTKTESTFVALKESLEQLAGLRSDFVDSEELETVKRSAQNAFVFRYDTPMKVLRRRAILNLLHYPSDYDDTYLENLFAVSRQDVKNVANDRWDMDGFVIVVVGSKNAYNLIVEGMKQPPAVLQGYKLERRLFNERLASK